VANHQPLFHSAIFVLLQNEKGEVLLQKRQNTGFMDERYDASASGHVEPLESLNDAAVRETAEEVGVIVQHGDLELIMLSQMDVDRPYLNYIFLCKKWQGEPRIMEPEKNSELTWYSIDNLPDDLTPTMALLQERKMQADTSKVEYVNVERMNKLLREIS
jgi:8-oxo-dGTP diphosphatase